MITKITTKVLLAGLAVGAAFTSCSKEQENIFDQSAAERLNSISAIYTERLTDSKGGWVMEYYPYTDNENLITGVGYLIMNRFNSDGSVYTMMKNKASYNTKWEDTSAWEVITDMGPVLTFNSWNKCYGRFTDPLDIDLTTGRSEDESGKGFQGDYEFVMVDVPDGGDHIMLKGKKRGIYQRLTRLPEGTDFEAYLDDIDAFKSTYLIDKCPYELIMTDNGIRYRVNNLAIMRPIFYEEGKDSVTYGVRMPYLITKLDDHYHLRFKDSVMVGSKQMEQEFIYDEDDDAFHGVNDLNNTIVSPYTDAVTFFNEKFEDQATFKVFKKQTAEISEKMRSYLAAASDGMTSINRNYQIDSISVRMTKDLGVTWQFKYQRASSAQEVVYKYDYQLNGNVAAFTYKEPAAVNGTNIMNRVDAIKTLITEVLSRKFVIEKYITLFNLRKMKMTAEDDPDLWFVINY